MWHMKFVMSQYSMQTYQLLSPKNTLTVLLQNTIWLVQEFIQSFSKKNLIQDNVQFQSHAMVFLRAGHKACKCHLI